MRTVIISGGHIDEGFLPEFLENKVYDCLIAADKGIEFCYHSHIRPHRIIGDFDSANGEILSFYEKEGIPIVYLKPEKDDSDTQSACRLAMDLGAEKITLLGSTGTRLDHVLANLQLLAWGESQGISMELYDANNYITVHTSSFQIAREEQFGKYVSFISLGDCVENLTLKGFKYPLDHYFLKNTDSGLSVSNEIQEEAAEIIFTGGTLLMIQSRD